MDAAVRLKRVYYLFTYFSGKALIEGRVSECVVMYCVVQPGSKLFVFRDSRHAQELNEFEAQMKEIHTKTSQIYIVFQIYLVLHTTTTLLYTVSVFFTLEAHVSRVRPPQPPLPSLPPTY